MTILHVVYSFPPDPPGGTELYVEGLARDLEQLGVASVVAAPGPASRSYLHAGLPVHRYAADPDVSIDAIYGRGDPAAAESFARVLDATRPDVVHLHALAPACSLTVVDEIAARGIPIVFTYHTPAASCPRGTLLLHGAEPCDGELRAARCASCVIADHGVPKSLASLVGHLPSALTGGLARVWPAGKPVTALRLTSLLTQSREALREFLAAAQRVVCLAPWVRPVLIANGVAADRLVDVPHGVERPEGLPDARATQASDGVIRVAHLGRVHRVKGTGLLLEALRHVPSDRIRVDVFGVVQDETGAAERDRLAALAAADDRVRWLPPLSPRDVIPTMADYDAVAVPSQWLETGPLVVLEAQAAGVPVLGSAWGGVADRVQDGLNGLLVEPPGDRAAWTAVLRRCVDEPGLLARLRTGVVAPRPRVEVAADMARVYRAVAREPLSTTAAG